MANICHLVMTQIMGICLFTYQVKTCYTSTTHLCLTSKWVTCVWGQSVSFVTLSDQLYELWSVHHNDHENIWQVCPNVDVCHINHLQKQCNYYALVSLYNAHLLVHLSKTPIMVMWLIHTYQCRRGKRPAASICRRVISTFYGRKM